MKKSLEINPFRTIEPNVGIVEVPALRMARPDSKKENRVGIRQFFEEFFLVLPKGN
jgi:ribosome-binding ATPase YchF (GTP1/OBG family)